MLSAITGCAWVPGWLVGPSLTRKPSVSGTFSSAGDKSEPVDLSEDRVRPQAVGVTSGRWPASSAAENVVLLAWNSKFSTLRTTSTPSGEPARKSVTVKRSLPSKLME